MKIKTLRPTFLLHTSLATALLLISSFSVSAQSKTSISSKVNADATLIDGTQTDKTVWKHTAIQEKTPINIPANDKVAKPAPVKLKTSAEILKEAKVTPPYRKTVAPANAKSVDATEARSKSAASASSATLKASVANQTNVKAPASIKGLAVSQNSETAETTTNAIDKTSLTIKNTTTAIEETKKVTINPYSQDRENIILQAPAKTLETNNSNLPIVSYNPDPSTNINLISNKDKDFTHSQIDSKAIIAGTAYGYEIFADGKLAFQQPDAYGPTGQLRFNSKEEALKAATLVINKMKQNKSPFIVTPQEINNSK